MDALLAIAVVAAVAVVAADAVVLQLLPLLLPSFPVLAAVLIALPRLIFLAPMLFLFACSVLLGLMAVNWSSTPSSLRILIWIFCLGFPFGFPSISFCFFVSLFFGLSLEFPFATPLNFPLMFQFASGFPLDSVSHLGSPWFPIRISPLRCTVLGASCFRDPLSSWVYREARETNPRIF